MKNQVPVILDVQQLQDALAVPPAQAGAAQNQAQDAQNVDGGDQPTAVVAPLAVPAAQPVHVPDADVVSCSCLLLAYLLSFCYRSLACFAGRRSLVSRSPAHVFCEFVSTIALLLEGFIASLSRPSRCIESVPLFCGELVSLELQYSVISQCNGEFVSQEALLSVYLSYGLS